MGTQFHLRSRQHYWLRIFDAWDFLNEAAFNGEMVRPKIMVWEKLYYKDRTAKGYKDGKKITVLGAYTPSQNTIFLWWKGGNKLETLYHEMVHQYVDEVLMRDNVSHGPVFQEAYKDGLENIVKYLRKRNKNIV